MQQRKRSRRGGAGAAKRGAAQESKKKRPGAGLPDLSALLGRFSDALSLLVVVQRSLSLQEFAGVGDEEITMRRALDELKSVYDEIDSVVPRLKSVAAVRLAGSEASD